jgi:membrane protein implicated in regulation of membrane protease activity
MLDGLLKAIGVACGLAVGALVGAGGPAWLDGALFLVGSIALIAGLQAASRRPEPPAPPEPPRGQTRVVVMGGAGRMR